VVIFSSYLNFSEIIMTFVERNWSDIWGLYCRSFLTWFGISEGLFTLDHLFKIVLQSSKRLIDSLAKTSKPSRKGDALNRLVYITLKVSFEMVRTLASKTHWEHHTISYWFMQSHPHRIEICAQKCHLSHLMSFKMLTFQSHVL